MACQRLPCPRALFRDYEDQPSPHGKKDRPSCRKDGRLRETAASSGISRNQSLSTLLHWNILPDLVTR